MSARLLLAPHGVPGRLVRTIVGLIAEPDASADALLLVVEAIDSRPWCSATFIGERHRLELRLHGEPTALSAGLGRLMTMLPETEFQLVGQIVAEARLAAVRVDPETDCLSLVIEVLTVID